MRTVEFPIIRREVLSALASLSDTEYQRRVWIDQVYPHPNYYDDFTQNIHMLYDDSKVLPDPTGCLNSVLLPGDEIKRLSELDEILGQLIDDLPGRSDAEYMADPRWAEVTSRAAKALAAMVLAGGYSDR